VVLSVSDGEAAASREPSSNALQCTKPSRLFGSFLTPSAHQRRPQGRWRRFEGRSSGHPTSGKGLVVFPTPMTETTPQNTPDHVPRLPSGRWAPGRSPNPGGRPRSLPTFATWRASTPKRRSTHWSRSVATAKPRLPGSLPPTRCSIAATESLPPRSNCASQTQSTSSNLSPTRRAAPMPYSRPPSRSRTPDARSNLADSIVADRAPSSSVACNAGHALGVDLTRTTRTDFF
jgi:hypothetical protein